MRSSQLSFALRPPVFTPEREQAWWARLHGLLADITSWEPATAEVTRRHLASRGCLEAEAVVTRRAQMLGGPDPLPLELLEDLSAHLVRGAMQLPAEVDR